MFHATELYGQNDRLFRTVPVRSPTSTAPLRASQGDLTDCRRAGLPVRPRPAASCQPDRVEERHPLRRDQDRPLQAQDARLLACISTRILSVPCVRTHLLTLRLGEGRIPFPSLSVQQGCSVASRRRCTKGRRSNSAASVSGAVGRTEAATPGPATGGTCRRSASLRTLTEITLPHPKRTLKLVSLYRSVSFKGSACVPFN